MEVKPVEIESVPMGVATTAMFQKVMEMRAFYLRLSVEHGAGLDGLRLQDGWQPNFQNGTWQREKKSEPVSAEGTTAPADRESDDNGRS